MDLLDVIAAPRRREILRLIWGREMRAGDIASELPVTFGAVSQHLAVMREAGVVEVRRDGTARYYRADRSRLGPLAPILESYWADALDRMAADIERPGT